MSTELRQLVFGERTYIMGVVNVTPDSFSGDGLMSAKKWVYAAVKLANHVARNGADIIDIGGESSRPAKIYSGVTSVSALEEERRVVPVIEQLKKTCVVPISIDTQKASVAEKALRAGATMINDVSMLKDPAMAYVAASNEATLIITHNRDLKRSNDVIDLIETDLGKAIEQSVFDGMEKSRIIVDPGIGFGKTTQQNLEILKNLGKLKKALKLPLLIGTSRKSFIGNVLGNNVTDRLMGTAATVSTAISNGADIVRVHDVKEIRDVSRMTDAIVRGWDQGLKT